MIKKGVEYKVLYMDENGDFIKTANKYVRQRNIGEFTLEVEPGPLKAKELKILRELQKALPAYIDMPLDGPNLILKTEIPTIEKAATAKMYCKCRCKCGRSRSCSGSGGGSGSPEPLPPLEPIPMKSKG